MRKTNTHKSLSRRIFLKKSALLSLGGAGMLSTLSGLNIAHAQTGAFSDYKALVCVFLFGGNDAFNMLVPRSDTEYETYRETRLSLAVEQASLLPISPMNSVPADYGLHPNMPELQELFGNQRLAFIGNVGALIEPTTQSAYINNTAALPPQLFSHNDQQNFVMSLQATKPQQGWASRIAEMMLDANVNTDLSMNITLTGANTFQAGGTRTPYSIPASGVQRLWAIDPNSADDFVQRRTQFFQSLLQQNHNHLFVDEYANVQTRAMELGQQISTALGNISPITTPFDETSRLAASLKMVAQLIAAHASLNVSRQIFFIGIGDYDTHGDQANRHPRLLRELSQSLKSFYDATVELELADQITTFTASDFGRTLTSNGDGTDHGWGSHQLVMGDAIDGGKIFGTMPDLTIGSSDDIGEGRIIPTTSVDQYAATLATWYGLPASALLETFPNLANFNTNNLGFYL